MKLTREQIEKLKPGHYLVDVDSEEFSILEYKNKGKSFEFLEAKMDGCLLNPDALLYFEFIHTDPIEEMEPFKSLLGGESSKIITESSCIDKVNEFCEESLPPEFFDMWEKVRHVLHKHRGLPSDGSSYDRIEREIEEYQKERLEKVAEREKSVNPDFFDKLIETLEWYAKAIKENFSDDVIQKFINTKSKGVCETKAPIEFVKYENRKVGKNGIPEFKHYSEPPKKPQKDSCKKVNLFDTGSFYENLDNLTKQIPNTKDQRLRERCIQYIVGKKPATHPATSIIREANEIYDYIKKGSVK